MEVVVMMVVVLMVMMVMTEYRSFQPLLINGIPMETLKQQSLGPQLKTTDFESI